MKELRFRKRIRRSKQGSRYRSDNVPKEKPESRIERVTRPLAQFSQIVLVAVVIFGYFYTVQPIYQKERLAEQVAQYEIQIGEQISSIEQAQSELVDLKEMTTFEREQSREANRLLETTTDELTELVAEREKLLRSLALAEQEKSRIENQTRFMQYKHFLPDGSPADTEEEVEIAIREGNRSWQRWRYFAGLSSRSTFIQYSDDANFAFTNKRNIDPASEFYPFTEEELVIWKNYGLGYPRHVALDLVDTTTTEQSLVKILGVSDIVDPADLDSWRAIARGQLEKKEDMWVAPYNPPQLVEEYKRALSENDERLAAELEKVEREFGDWAKIRNARRRDLFERGYKVGKNVVLSWANAAKITREQNYEAYANRFRKSAADEVERLLDIEDGASN